MFINFHHEEVLLSYIVRTRYEQFIIKILEKITNCQLDSKFSLLLKLSGVELYMNLAFVPNQLIPFSHFLTSIFIKVFVNKKYVPRKRKPLLNC